MSKTSVENIKISKAKINDIDIQLEHIYIIDIYESLMQPGITGFIQIIDFQAIVELGNVFAGDDLLLEFTVQEEGKKTITNKFKIYSLEGNKLLPDKNYTVSVFGFCSPWLIDGLTKIVSKNYEEKYIHEIIADLLKECGAEVGFIEPTKQKLENFVTPLWTPYHSIKYLLGYALSKTNNAGYLCWTDLMTGKVNVATVDYLNKGTLGKFKSFTVYPSNIRYEGRIHECSIETNYDIIRLINNGLPATKVYGFNYNKGKEFVSDKKLSDLTSTKLSKKFPIPTKYKDKQYTSFRFIPLFPNNKDSIASKDNLLQDLLDGSLLNEYTLLTTDVFKLNILTSGEPDRRVGWLAEVDFPSQNKIVGNKEGNKQLKGDYLIRDIKHSFSYMMEYRQAITLVSDGYKEFNRPEIMDWK